MTAERQNRQQPPHPQLAEAVGKVLGFEGPPPRCECPLCNHGRESFVHLTKLGIYKCFNCLRVFACPFRFVLALRFGDDAVRSLKDAVAFLKPYGIDPPDQQEIAAMFAAQQARPSRAAIRAAVAKTRMMMMAKKEMPNSPYRLPDPPSIPAGYDLAAAAMGEDEAVAWAVERGVYFFPVRGLKFADEENGKGPKTPAAGFKWKDDASCDPVQIRKWLREGYILGINLRLSGLAVLDFDRKHFADRYQAPANKIRRDLLAGVPNVRRSADALLQMAMVRRELKEAGPGYFAVSPSKGFHAIYATGLPLSKCKITTKVGEYEYPTNFVEFIGGGDDGAAIEEAIANGAEAAAIDGQGEGYVVAYTRYAVLADPKATPWKRGPQSLPDRVSQALADIHTWEARLPADENTRAAVGRPATRRLTYRPSAFLED